MRIELNKPITEENSTCTSTLLNQGSITKEQADDTMETHVPDIEDMECETMDDGAAAHDYLLGLLNADSTMGDLMEQQDDIKNLTQQVSTLTQSCHNADILKTVKKHLYSTISLLRHNATEKQGTVEDDQQPEDLEKRTMVAPNSNMTPQLRFHSTKKKRTSKQRWAKCTMKATLVTVCGICWKEDDKVTSDTNLDSCIDWMECEICGLWVHKSCVAGSTTDTTYVCNSCLTINTITE